MKNKLSLAIACGLTTMCVATTGYSASHSKAGEKSFNIGGDVELDLTGTDDNDDTSSFNHGGRIKLNAVGMLHGDNGYFVKGVAQPLVLFNPGTTALTTQDEDLFLNNDAIAVDDAYFQIGKTDSWDIQMGRFEAMDLLPLGKDTLVANVDGVVVYGANDVRGRKDDVFHTALHVGSADKLLFELGVQARKNGDDKVFEIRPAVSYQLGKVKLHAGYEDLENDQSGMGIGASFNLGGGNLNVSVALAEDYINPRVSDSTLDTTAVAVNYTKGPWGVGYLHAEADVSTNSAASPTIDTVYGAYTLPIFSIKDASVTFAASYSEGSDINVDGNLVDDELAAVRARFNYTF